jgi:hypothetical protein
VNVASGEPLPEIDKNDGREDSEDVPTDDKEDKPLGEITYVLNINTKKIHKPTCTHAKNLSAEKRKETDLTKEELIAQGYSPCGTCKP